MTVAVIPKNSREELRVGLETFNGVRLVNLRVWYRSETGEWRPGKQGLALRVELLFDLRRAIQQAESDAQRQGLAPEGTA